MIKRLLCWLGWHSYGERRIENVSVGGLVHTFTFRTCGACGHKTFNHYMRMDRETMVEVLLDHIKEFGSDEP